MKNVIVLAIVAVALVFVFAVPRWKQAQRVKNIDDWFENRYGTFGKTTDEIFSHENSTNSMDILGALHWRIGRKANVRGQSSLTDTERTLLATYWVEAEVNNGGFDQYFFNSAGDNAEIYPRVVDHTRAEDRDVERAGLECRLRCGARHIGEINRLRPGAGRARRKVGDDEAGNVDCQNPHSCDATEGECAGIAWSRNRWQPHRIGGGQRDGQILCCLHTNPIRSPTDTNRIRPHQRIAYEALGRSVPWVWRVKRGADGSSFCTSRQLLMSERRNALKADGRDRC